MRRREAWLKPPQHVLTANRNEYNEHSCKGEHVGSHRRPDEGWLGPLRARACPAAAITMSASFTCAAGSFVPEDAIITRGRGIQISVMPTRRGVILLSGFLHHLRRGPSQPQCPRRRTAVDDGDSGVPLQQEHRRGHPHDVAAADHHSLLPSNLHPATVEELDAPLRRSRAAAAALAEWRRRNDAEGDGQGLREGTRASRDGVAARTLGVHGTNAASRPRIDSSPMFSGPNPSTSFSIEIWFNTSNSFTCLGSCRAPSERARVRTCPPVVLPSSC